MKTLLVLFSLLLCGSALAAEQCTDGTPIVRDLKACKSYAEGCYVDGVVHVDKYADQETVKHECEHAVYGMRHTEPWVRVAAMYTCAVVTKAGGQWQSGDVMCRGDGESAIKLMKDERVRERTYKLANIYWNPEVQRYASEARAWLAANKP